MQTGNVGLQLFSVRIALFFALRIFFSLGLFGAFTLTFSLLFGLFLRFFFLFSFGFPRLSRLYLLFFLFLDHDRLLSGSTLFGNGLT